MKIKRLQQVDSMFMIEMTPNYELYDAIKGWKLLKMNVTAHAREKKKEKRVWQTIYKYFEWNKFNTVHEMRTNHKSQIRN